MKSFGKIAISALMLAGSAVGATVATTAPAASHVSVGIGIGIPGPVYHDRGYYGPRDNPRCADRRWAYDNSKFCPSLYGAGGIPQAYGPDYYGYYDSGFYGPGYYEPAVNGFWFTDNFGHRRYHGGRFDGRGFHRGHWHH